jgi:hypothetical protein
VSGSDYRLHGACNLTINGAMAENSAGNGLNVETTSGWVSVVNFGGSSNAGTAIEFDSAHDSVLHLDTGSITVTGAGGDLSIAGCGVSAFADLEIVTAIRDVAGNLVALTTTATENQALFQNCVNQNGGPLAPGFIVRSNGTATEVVKAQADSTPDSTGVFGVWAMTTQSGDPGMVAISGEVTIRMDAAPTPGRLCYLSDVNAGQGTDTAPAIALPVGYITDAFNQGGVDYARVAWDPALSAGGGTSSGPSGTPGLEAIQAAIGGPSSYNPRRWKLGGMFPGSPIYAGGTPMLEQGGLLLANTNVQNKLFALPEIIARKVKITELAVALDGSAFGVNGQDVHIGIYSNVGGGVNYPDALLFDSGALQTTAGASLWKVVSGFTLDLDVGDVIWIAAVSKFGAFSSPVTMTVIRSQKLAAVIGFPTFNNGDTANIGQMAQSGGVGWVHDQSYGPLPDPFPNSSPSLILANDLATFPGVFLNYELR